MPDRLLENKAAPVKGCGLCLWLWRRLVLVLEETGMNKAIFYAILAAALYALNAPVSKLLLQSAPPTMMATMNGMSIPASVAMPEAMGTSATIVPTDVPMAMEMKHAARNSPA